MGGDTCSGAPPAFGAGAVRAEVTTGRGVDLIFLTLTAGFPRLAPVGLRGHSEEDGRCFVAEGVRPATSGGPASRVVGEAQRHENEQDQRAAPQGAL